ncbi:MULTISPECIES: SGNH/GDSL hydrolase family protein [Lysinibacillus]|jgi:lysophospholipase L1-like esterase|uniref:SGNH/GDSL hydrolase family protein n=1 Tax=Lysinibacillus TaxID=400634 RepID=UPI0004D9888A|nr:MULTISPECIES: GDSL-type esterase/lipase family protein [Lysinibacillus]AJK86428.1 GDSL-like lipase/acylhydrolase [Lysinibacillus fusiformis]KHK50151.1 GDSL-like lipase/acylhydrolase [Lysinibacillus sp. A1]MDC6269129.1 GDSL-type esterase/lipase family protein [Lysinibacillus sphaericus]MDN4967093.1 GDSL-type esterase/lipase family protein [Lysinibacillus fusiformis]
MKVGLIGDSLTEGRPGVSFYNLLKLQYPHISFDNLGNPGETIKSLLTRLEKAPLQFSYDLLILWIGVNDVYSKLLKVQAQPVAKDHIEFEEYCLKVLEKAHAASKNVVLVSPALVGEDLQNHSNQEIKELTSIMESVALKSGNIYFVNMQNLFKEHLENLECSSFINKNVMRVLLDVLFYKNPLRIDKLSQKRGLHVTLDGVHLNSKGANIVAQQYSSIIELYGDEGDKIGRF